MTEHAGADLDAHLAPSIDPLVSHNLHGARFLTSPQMIRKACQNEGPGEV